MSGEKKEEEQEQSTSHPLDPLTAEEVNAVGKWINGNLIKSVQDEVLKQKPIDMKRVRFVDISLDEPSRKELDAKSTPRIAKTVLFDRGSNGTIEIFTRINADHSITLESSHYFPNTQTMVIAEEFFEAQEIVIRDPQFIAAMARRGLTDPSMFMVEPWSNGWNGVTEEDGHRLLRTQVWTRVNDPEDNGYAHPVDGLIACVDMNSGTVWRLEDHYFDESTQKLKTVTTKGGEQVTTPLVTLPRESFNYLESVRAKFGENRGGNDNGYIKPVLVTQPEGVNWKRNKNLIEWGAWKFRVGWNVREGLTLHDISFANRNIIYRASIVEMVAPYGTPSAFHHRKNAFDAGEYGIGACCTSLVKGCDCVGVIEYFDVVTCDPFGAARQTKNIICLHEEDAGVLWKHRDWRLSAAGDSGNADAVRRNTRLVVSCFATVGNYEFAYFWYFTLDGGIECDIKLTGIINTSGYETNQMDKYAAKVGENLYGHHHQHWFSSRLIMDVDSGPQSILEVDVVPESDDLNPYNNAFITHETLLSSEQTAQRDVDPWSARTWKVINTQKLNRVGQSVAYKLVPGGTAKPFAKPTAWFRRRAPHLNHHLWVTRYDKKERFPAGEYSNMSKGVDTIAAWAEKRNGGLEGVEGGELVVWYNFGVTHIVRLEDFPVMPVQHCGFHLVPCGFFGENPSVGLPSTSHKNCHK